MRVKKIHDWDMSYSQARALQNKLADKVQFTAISRQPKLIAGLDCAIMGNAGKIIAAVIVLKFPELEVIEITHAVCDLNFPYIPGLLSFREAPACIEAVKNLKITPDVFIVDGQGIAHPRRLGLASHLGLFFDKPVIGCAKSRLTGKFDEPPPEKGKYSLLKDKDEIIGAVVRTRANVKPVYISVGNKCLLEDAIDITLSCTNRYRLPEPTRLAHQLVSKTKMQLF